MNQSFHIYLTDRIRHSGGRIPFADYMTEVLYHPEWGYYNRQSMTIGGEGDFDTSPVVHPIFGHCVARMVYRLWERLGSPCEFTIIEMGAGTGALARDLMREWDRLTGLAKQDVKVNYRIVEQSPSLQKKQQDTTREDPLHRYSWFTSLKEIPDYGTITGVIVTNELFDALPVHRLILQEGKLQERYVSLSDQTAPLEWGFQEVTGPLSDPGLAQLLPEEVRSQLEEGDRVEVCPMAGEVLRDMAELLEKGSILTIDYGDVSPEVYWQSIRGNGIRCYFNRTLNHNPYERIGEQDITCNVDFSYLERKGAELGLTKIWYSNQSEFLEHMGFLEKVKELQREAFRDLRADFELQKMLTLYLPQGLGDSCKVLIQSKGE